MGKNLLKYMIRDLQMFAEDPKPGEPEPENQTEEPGNEDKYITAIKVLRSTTVPKDKYEKLEGENKLLLEALIDGKEIPGVVPGSADQKTDKAKRIQELRGDLFGLNRKDMSNLETAKSLMELRRLVIEETGVDPVISPMKNPTPEDVKAADDACDLIESCIEQADGDSAVFTAILQSHMQDDKLLAAAARRPKR